MSKWQLASIVYLFLATTALSAGASEAMRLAAHKLAIKTKFTQRMDLMGGE